MTKLTEPIFNLFNIKRLLLTCQIYDNDLLDNIISSISTCDSDEYQDQIYDRLVEIVRNKISRNINQEIKIMKEIFISKLALVPLIFGIRDSNKSLIAVDLSYYLNIPNIVFTRTVQETLNICNLGFPCEKNYQNNDFSKYLEESKQIVLSLKVDIKKAIKQGKSIILCGYNLFLPYIFELNNDGLFPKPNIIYGSNSQKFPLYYLNSKDESSVNILFIPIALRVNINTNQNENKYFDSNIQDEVIEQIMNNKFEWPVHIVDHNVNDPQSTSKYIHLLIINSLKELFNTNGIV